MTSSIDTSVRTALSARDALTTVRGIQEARELVRPLLFAARDEERRIGNSDAEGIAHPNTDFAALDAAEALTRRYWQIENALHACITRFMGDREDNMEDLLARLERDARAEEDAAGAAEAAAQGYFIALPTKLAMNEVEAIWGIGRTAEEAWSDAWGSLNCRLPDIEEVEGSWRIWNPINQTTEEFFTEEAAQAALRETGFRAEPCTEALYLRVKAEGYDSHGRNSYDFVLNGGVYDVEEREAA